MQNLRYKILFYATVQGSEPVREWLQSLDKPERLQLGQALQVLQINGPALPMPYARTLGKGLFELRERINRVQYGATPIEKLLRKEMNNER